MGAGLGLGLLAYASWRLVRALAIVTARLVLLALGAAVWTVTGIVVGLAWCLEHSPRRSAPELPRRPDGPTLAELLEPYTLRTEGNAS